MSNDHLFDTLHQKDFEEERQSIVQTDRLMTIYSCIQDKWMQLKMLVNIYVLI
jgi:hypothetical protein